MKRISLAAMVALASFIVLPVAFAADAMDTEDITIRTAPLGRVNTSTEALATLNAVSTKATGSASGAHTSRTPKEIYAAHCAMCHTSGLAGAPKLRNATDWKTRQAQGMTTLLKHAIHGLNAMPPKGTCTECSEEDLKKTIQFMLP